MPEDCEESYIQMNLFVDRKKNDIFSAFLENMLDEVERNEFPIYAGIKNGIPVYFLYELELRKLQNGKADMERQEKG